MYKRYENSSVEKSSITGKRYLSETIYPEILPSSIDVYIISKKGDRLDNLAYSFYNDVRLWWIIAQANHIGKGSFYVEPGLQLRIPMNLDQINLNLRQLNS